MRRLHSVKRLGVAVVAVAIAGSVMVAAPAQAATYPVSGTVFSSQAYYLSAAVRTTGLSSVQVKLESIPSRNIRWRLYSTNKGTYFAGPVEITNNSTVPIAVGVIVGTKFQNSYAQGGGTCVFGCGYNFAGNEYY